MPGPPDAALSVRCPEALRDGRNRPLLLGLPMPADRAGRMVLVVRSTRFDRLTILFRLADGSVERQEVARGDFGRRWHLGNQIAFTVPAAQPIVTATLRIEGLEELALLRVRFMAAETAERRFELAAALIGGALALLAIAALYNFGIALAVRRRFFLWHGLWATSVFCWGVVWSQLALAMWPGIAGMASARTATFLSCLAILFATASAVSALRASLSPTIRVLIPVLAGIVVLLGALADLPGADLTLLGRLLAIATLLTLAAVTTAAVVAWRRGRAEARDLLIAWTVPMLALGATQIFQFRDGLFGGGPQIAVLFASAFQTLCLSAIATLRLNALRAERDAAVAAGTALTELAERDPLTGLLNRRGFVARCEAAFGDLPNAPFGLLLIDLDDFKSVNDRFGHEAGDAVLVTLATALRLLEQTHLCLAGRLGGEEFVIGVSGMPSFALSQFAEHVRGVLRACDHGLVSRQATVTVSIGVAQGAASGPFRVLYGRADRALYDAKHAGRDRVVFPDAALDAADQLTLSLDGGAGGQPDVRRPA